MNPAYERRTTLINMSRTVAELSDELLDSQKMTEQLNQVSINDQHRSTDMRAKMNRLENDFHELQGVHKRVVEELQNKVNAADELSIKFRSETTDLRKQLGYMEGAENKKIQELEKIISDRKISDENAVEAAADIDVTEMIYNGRKELFDVITQINKLIPKLSLMGSPDKRTEKRSAVSEIQRICDEALK